MATIIQKKTWTSSKITRDINIQAGPYGKSDTYKAQFSWNDASINVRVVQILIRLVLISFTIICI